MIKKKIYAFVSQDSGFSYLETIFSLSVISLIAFILPAVFSTFSQFSMVDTNLDGDIFVIDIIKEIQSAEEVSTNGKDTITIKSGKSKIDYRLNNNRIIKSINDEGFITVLFDIVAFKVSEGNDFIKISIKTSGEFDEEFIIGK